MHYGNQLRELRNPLYLNFSFPNVNYSDIFCKYVENMDITLKTKTHLYEKDGHVFYNITGTSVDYKLDGLKLRLDNLFDGVKVLGNNDGI